MTAKKSAETSAAHPTHCLNCGVGLAGDYCHECGQRNTRARLTLRGLFSDIFDHVFSLDSRLLRTLRGLFTRPGATIRAYIAGERTRYANPLRFLVLAVALFFIVRSMLGINVTMEAPEEFAKLSAPTPEGVYIQEKSYEFLDRFFDWFTIAATPLYGILFPIFFRKRGYTLAERLVFACFMQGQITLILLPLLPFILLGSSLYAPASFLVYLGSAVWIIVAFAEARGFWGITRAILFALTYYLAVAVLLMACLVPYLIWLAVELHLETLAAP